MAIEIPSVNFIPYILHHSQLRLHKGAVAAIVLMTHHTTFQLYMRQVKIIISFRVFCIKIWIFSVYRNGIIAPERPSIQNLAYIFTSEKCPACSLINIH